MSVPKLCLTAALLLLSAGAEAKPLKPTGAEASTSLPDDAEVSYDVKNSFDRKQSTVWVEGDTSSSGLGSWIRYDLEGTPVVTELRIWNGNWYTYDYFIRHNRVKEMEISFSDGSTQTVTLKDEMVPQVVKIDKPVATSFVKVKVKGIYSGSTFNDTVISELIIYDNSPSDTLAVSAVKASSVYPADADGNYEAKNVEDGVLDSMWCEGDKGDGTNQWLEFTLAQPTTVSSFVLVNGNAFSPAYHKKGNRAATATLRFSDGSTQEVAIKDFFLPQTIKLTPVSTSSVKVTFTKAYPGSDFNDLCIAEASFKP